MPAYGTSTKGASVQNFLVISHPRNDEVHPIQIVHANSKNGNVIFATLSKPEMKFVATLNTLMKKTRMLYVRTINEKQRLLL